MMETERSFDSVMEIVKEPEDRMPEFRTYDPHALRPRRSKDELTGQELRCLYQASLGLSNKLIGEELGISDSTVHFHMRNACHKLGHQTRTGAVAAALRKGVLT